MNRKWYLLILIVFMSMFSVTAFAQKCGRCNGYGQINKSVSAAGYGLAKKIGDCNICGHMIFSGESHHHVTCPSCGGSGKRKSSSTQSSSSNNSSTSRSSSNDQWDGLTTDEWMYKRELIKQSVSPNIRYDKCSNCNGTAQTPCFTCRGTGVFMGRECPTCLGIFPYNYCSICKGTGQIKVETPKTNAELQEINRKIQELNEIGWARLNGKPIQKSSQRSSSTNSSVPSSPTSYQVTIKAFNSSDEIYVNGKYYTKGTYTGQFYPGNHTIECRNTGRYSTSKSILVSNPMTVTMPELRQMPSLKISTRNDISIYLDGRYITSSGSTTQYVDYGSHKVEFKKNNHHTITKTINVNSLSNNTITVNSLEPIVGSLNITSNPAGMTVKVDGEEKGITPLIIKDVIIGNHKVELSKVHYYTDTKDVEVKESEQSSVNMKMTEYARIKFTSNVYDASVYVDGQFIGSTPMTQDVVAGRHTFEVEGDHHRPNRRTITVAGNTGDQYFRLIRQYQRKNVFYIEPTFQCGGLSAIGGTVGFYAANVNIEGTYLYGLDKTDPIYWIAEDPNELYTPYEYTYKPSFAGGKIGYGFIIGTRVRITPQIGAGVLMINGSGDYGKSRGQAMLGSGGLRLECALAPCLNLVAEPEYSLPLTKSDNYKSISEVEPKLGKWGKGFHCRIGLSLFW